MESEIMEPIRSGSVGHFVPFVCVGENCPKASVHYAVIAFGIVLTFLWFYYWLRWYVQRCYYYYNMDGRERREESRRIRTASVNYKTLSPDVPPSAMENKTDRCVVIDM